MAPPRCETARAQKELGLPASSSAVHCTLTHRPSAGPPIVRRPPFEQSPIVHGCVAMSGAATRAPIRPHGTEARTPVWAA